jgi:Protein of unknown function (DUF1391)
LLQWHRINWRAFLLQIACALHRAWCIMSHRISKRQERNMNKTINTGNNETLSRGVFKNADGTFTAMTYSQSKTFKTQAGAVRWFAAKTN